MASNSSQKKIPIFHAPHDTRHNVENFDSPGRSENIRKRLAELNQAYDMYEPFLRNDKFISQVHDQQYLDYLRDVCKVLMEDEILRPEIFAFDREKQRKPKSLKAQIGWWGYESTTGLCRESYQACLESAYCALSGASLLKGSNYQSELKDHQNSDLVYALCRPPGHHATTSRFGGFCYLNNAAIAANFLTLRNPQDASEPNKDSSSRRRVAVLDIDYHGGNGTQEIFYERDDVLFVSIHADPDETGGELYYWGFVDETGEGKGKGFNLNIPVWGQNVNGTKYLDYLNQALNKIKEFNPEFLVISYGIDTYVKDNLGTFALDLQDYFNIGKEIASVIKVPKLVVQEGGYHEDLGECVHQFLQGLDSAKSQ